MAFSKNANTHTHTHTYIYSNYTENVMEGKY